MRVPISLQGGAEVAVDFAHYGYTVYKYVFSTHSPDDATFDAASAKLL